MGKVLNQGFVRLTNRSTQRVDVQVTPPGGDFYATQRQARLLPGKSIVLPKSHLMPAQLENLQARRQLSVIDTN